MAGPDLDCPGWDWDEFGDAGLAGAELPGGGFPELCDTFCDTACDLRTADHSIIIAVRTVAYRFSKQVSLGSGRYLTSMECTRQLLYELFRARAITSSPASTIIRPWSCTGKPDTYNKGFAGYDW